MKLHYLEIVSPQVEAICLAYQAAAGLQFEPPDELLGGARTARLPDGSLIGIRGPLHASEEPVVRPYWLVADIQAAATARIAARGPSSSGTTIVDASTNIAISNRFIVPPSRCIGAAVGAHAATGMTAATANGTTTPSHRRQETWARWTCIGLALS